MEEPAWDPCCEDCRFYVATPAGDGGVQLYGECRRYPPTAIFLGTGEKDAMFPFVVADEWCGEYKPKDAKPSAPPPVDPILDALVKNAIGLRASGVTRRVLRNKGRWSGRAGYPTVRDLLTLTHMELEEAHGMGPVTLGSVLDFLQEHGLRLANHGSSSVVPQQNAVSDPKDASGSLQEG